MGEKLTKPGGPRTLEWRHTTSTFPFEAWVASTPFGVYIIEKEPQDPEVGHPITGDWWFSVKFNEGPCCHGADLEAAQDAAQRDFAGRLLKCHGLDAGFDWADMFDGLHRICAEHGIEPSSGDILAALRRDTNKEPITPATLPAHNGDVPAALRWAMDEIDALSNKLCQFAYPQGMAMVGRSDQQEAYERAVAARAALAAAPQSPSGEDHDR